jgi:CMP-N-acetylneuraminic acid synthetase
VSEPSPERPSTLALVPARSGSRGIPGKNVKLLAGRPLIDYALSAIADSGCADRTVVSTDSEEIAAVARTSGAETPFLRPPELATDTAPAIELIDHALGWLAAEEGYAPDLILYVQPTEPFVQPEQIRAALDLLLREDADAVITTVEVPRNHHPFHVRLEREDGTLAFERPDDHYASPNRQSDPPRYAFANLYWFRRASYLREHHLETGRLLGMPVDPLTALDLNTPVDWEFAELLMQRGLA